MTIITSMLVMIYKKEMSSVFLLRNLTFTLKCKNGLERC